MRKVLIVNPNTRTGYLFVPYLYLCLKSHYQEFGQHSNQWEWLEPINDIEDLSFDSIIERIVDSEPDVIGFSLFLWNVNACHLIAQEVRKRLPNTLIIFGGPHLDYRFEQRWFLCHPYVDLICNPNGYGEDFMTTLLDMIVEDRVDQSNIPNAVYPTSKRSGWLPSKVDTDKRGYVWPSFVFEGSEDYIRYLRYYASQTNRDLFVCWETTRGCPYMCAYCEWGGGIGSKVSMKPEQVISRELAFIEQVGIGTLHINDANFGITKRDLWVAEQVVSVSKNNGLRQVWLGGMSKTKKDVVEKIDLMWLDAGIHNDTYTVAVNAMTDKQLKAIGRTQVPLQDQVDMINRVRSKHPVQADFELMLGLPESTLDTFYKEFDIIAQTEAWRTERFVWALLPETPAAAPQYRQKYKIRTAPAAAQIDDWSLRDAPTSYNILRDPDYTAIFEAVVETSTYSSDDWIEMYIMDNFARAAEMGGHTTELRKQFEQQGTPASVFFRTMWKQIANHEVVQHMKHNLNEFVTGRFGSEQNYLWICPLFDPTRRVRYDAYFSLLFQHDVDFLGSLIYNINTTKEFVMPIKRG